MPSSRIRSSPAGVVGKEKTALARTKARQARRTLFLISKGDKYSLSRGVNGVTPLYTTSLHFPQRPIPPQSVSRRTPALKAAFKSEVPGSTSISYFFCLNLTLNFFMVSSYHVGKSRGQMKIKGGINFALYRFRSRFALKNQASSYSTSSTGIAHKAAMIAAATSAAMIQYQKPAPQP